MELFTLSNLTAWNLQIALLADAGAILPRAPQIDAPSIRHALLADVAAALFAAAVRANRGTCRRQLDATTAAVAPSPARRRAVGTVPSAATVATPSIATEWLHALRTRLAGVAWRSCSSLASRSGARGCWLGIVRLAPHAPAWRSTADAGRRLRRRRGARARRAPIFGACLASASR